MDNLVLDKSKAFAIRSVKLYQYLTEEKREFILSKQMLRSGTSIGANCREAVRAQSKADFVAKLNISLKEADETSYWIELLHETGYLNDRQYTDIYRDVDELIKIFVSIIKSAKNDQSQ